MKNLADLADMCPTMDIEMFSFQTERFVYSNKTVIHSSKNFEIREKFQSAHPTMQSLVGQCHQIFCPCF